MLKLKVLLYENIDRFDNKQLKKELIDKDIFDDEVQEIDPPAGANTSSLSDDVRKRVHDITQPGSTDAAPDVVDVEDDDEEDENTRTESGTSDSDGVVELG